MWSSFELTVTHFSLLQKFVVPLGGFSVLDPEDYSIAFSRILVSLPQHGYLLVWSARPFTHTPAAHVEPFT